MIHSLRQFALTVPDLQVGADFYTAFGLDMRTIDGGLGFRSPGREHDEVVLIEGGTARKFRHVSFAADAAGIAAIADRLKTRGIAPIPAPRGAAQDGLWFHDADGNAVHVAEASPSPVPAEDIPLINRPGTIARSGLRGCPTRDTPARPRRLGHMILFTPDVARQQAFYGDILGLKVSDTIVDGYAAFLRAPGDSDHHILGLLKSGGSGFHHASFEMASIDEAALGAQRLLGQGYRHAWGPGRHGVGSNYFHYFRDPWNGMAEYYCDMDHVAGDFEWPVSDWTKKDGMFLWSADGPPPPDFGTNYELEPVA